MSWVKRNLYFLVSGIVAVVLLGAAGWFCYSEWQGNNQSWDALNQVYSQLNELNNKPITANQENIAAARSQMKEIKELNSNLRKFLTPISPIPAGKIDDRTLAFAVRETISQLRADAGPNIAVPQDYAFSFSAQRDKAVYVQQSWGQLAQQLGEVKTICDILFSNRINSLDSVLREHTADDLTSTAQQADYLDYTSVTNNNANGGTTILTPYQVTFGCFDTELGNILASFANQSYGIIVRTLEVEPADLEATDMNMPPTQVPMQNFNPRGAVPYRGGGVPFRGGGAPPPAMTPQPGMSAPEGNLPMVGGLPVIVDEKRLRITMLLEVVKITPSQGR